MDHSHLKMAMKKVLMPFKLKKIGFVAISEGMGRSKITGGQERACLFSVDNKFPPLIHFLEN